MTKTRVLLAADHTVVSQRLRKILESDAEIEIVGEVDDGGSAVEAAERLHPTVVLIDMGLPGLSGIEATSQIARGIAGVSVLILATQSDDVSVRQGLKSGARGYVLKDSQDLDLVRAVKSLARGGSYFSPSVSKVLLAGYLDDASTTADDAALFRLTGREREMLHFIAEGKTNKEIAHILSLSINTIESHRKHMMEKLDLHNTAEIVRFAVRKGIVQ